MVKKLQFRLCILLILLGCTGRLAAQVQFKAALSQQEAGAGEPFELTFSVNSDGGRFSPPDLSAFQLLSGPNVSNSMTSINGNTTVSNSYSYVLLATKEGNYTIGPAYMVIGGRRLGTAPLHLKITKGHAMQQAAPSGGQQAPGNAAVNPADLSKAVFIKAIPSKTTVYQGEQLTLSYLLYTRVSIEDSRVDKLPDLNGFWNEDDKNQPQQARWRSGEYKGLRYNVADIKKTFLVPQRSGDITIDPVMMTFILSVPEAGGDIMDQMFGSFRSVNYQVKSSPVVIHVKALPLNGRPAGFSGAVGQFSLQASADKAELKTGESLNYQLRISGNGNLKLLSRLQTRFPETFEQYDPKITDTVYGTAPSSGGSRVYSYLLMPKKAGEYKLLPPEFSYFNPATGKYASVSVNPVPVKVLQGAAEPAVSSLPADRDTAAQDIAPLKTGPYDAGQTDHSPSGGIWYILLLLLGPLACAAAFVYRNRYRENNSDLAKVRHRKAGKVASRHLAAASRQLEAGQPKAVYDAVFHGLYGYLSDKLSLPVASLNKSAIRASLQAVPVSPELTDRLLDTLDRCEMARYAPVAAGSAREILSTASTLINDIENEFK